MTREIEICVDRLNLRWMTKTTVFPGGELHVEIPDLPVGKPFREVVVIARLQSSDDIMRLVLTNEILSRTLPNTTMILCVPYLPYARQDRVTDRKTAFSLKSVAGIINDMMFSEVLVIDPHSDVGPALIENITVLPVADIIADSIALDGMINTCRPSLVAPDAGACKKVESVAKRYGIESVIVATKKRDVLTGEILGTEIHSPVSGHCLIVDDICDGGRTFIELAKVLLQRGASGVSLYVTHGIFSKGLSVFDGIIDHIYTTDSFLTEITKQSTDFLTVQSIQF